MQKQLDATIIEEDGATVLSLNGDIDVAVETEIEAALAAAAEQANGQLTIDLGGVEFMDSTGVNAIVAVLKRSSCDTIFVRRPTAVVRRILELTGVDRLVAVVD